jgi:hypothetical protein
VGWAVASDPENADTHGRTDLRFLDHFSRILVIAERHKFGMPQPVSFGLRE